MLAQSIGPFRSPKTRLSWATHDLASWTHFVRYNAAVGANNHNAVILSSLVSKISSWKMQHCKSKSSFGISKKFT